MLVIQSLHNSSETVEESHRDSGENPKLGYWHKILKRRQKDGKFQPMKETQKLVSQESEFATVSTL